MGVLMTAVLCAAGMCQDQPDYWRGYGDPAPKAVQGVAGLRMGAWTGRDLSFEATRTDGLVSTSKQNTYFSTSLMLGLEFSDKLLLLGSVEADFASKIRAGIGGLYLGWHERPKERYGKGVPDDATFYGGVLVGKIDVDEPNFGEFDKGVGFGGGLSFGWALGQSTTFDLFGEYRLLEFDYKKDVVSGDTKIGGNTALLGAGISFRF